MANVLICEKKCEYAYGREVLRDVPAPEFYPEEGGCVLRPFILSSACRISVWNDGSGSIKDENNRPLAKWEGLEDSWVVSRDGRKFDLVNPYEPGGLDVTSDMAAFLNKAELQVAMLYPEYVRSELSSRTNAAS